MFHNILHLYNLLANSMKLTSLTILQASVFSIKHADVCW